MDAVENCVKAFGNEQWVEALKECRAGVEYGEPQAQYLLAKLLSREQIDKAHIEAQDLNMKIAVRTAKHQEKFDYRRKVMVLASKN